MAASTMSMFPTFFTSLFGEMEPRAGSEPITKKETDRGSVRKCGIQNYGFSGMQGWRVTMEDSHLVCANIPVISSNGNTSYLSEGHAIFGVLDGHGGDFTSEFAAANFMKIFSRTSSLYKYSKLSSSDQKDVPGIEMLRPALAETFATLDVEIRERQNKRNDTVLALTEKMAEEATQNGTQQQKMRFERSGSTCVVVMVTPSHIICANAGDSRAVMQRGDKVLPLSFDHKPNNIPELERISDSGGFVKSKRVDGDLAVSRGLGDFSYKSNETMTVEKQKVVPNPEFVVYPRDRKADEFMILACDGVWDVATNEECARFVRDLMKDGECDLGLICEEAIDVCLEKNSRDNMTIGVVTFDGARISEQGLMSTVHQRRAARHARNFEASAKHVATTAAANFGLNFSKPCTSEGGKASR